MRLPGPPFRRDAFLKIRKVDVQNDHRWAAPAGARRAGAEAQPRLTVPNPNQYDEDAYNDAAVVLHAAHKELQRLVTTKDLVRLCRFVSLQYSDIIYNGLWFTPTREALDAFVEKVQERVTGVIRLKLFKGDSRIVGRKSPYALYDHALATYDAGDRFDHTGAVGFIKIWGLPVETAARKAPGAKKPSTIAVGKA